MILKMLADHWRKALLITALVPTIAINGIAWMQARSMTHFVTARQRTAKPEKLSIAEKLKIILTGVEVPRPVNHRTPKDEGFVYETHRIAIGDRETLEAWFVPNAANRGIAILFPPYAGSKDALLTSAKIFHTLGYAALLVDFRGAGGSSGSDTTLGVREAQDVTQTVAYVRQHWSKQPLILYGASMGAVAVMRAITDGVSPNAAILESPFDRLLNTVRHRFSAMGLPTFPAAELIVFWGGMQQQIDGFAHNPVDYAKAVRCPVLLLHGEADTRVTTGDAAAIVANLQGRKTFVVFPGAIGHGSLATDAPEQWKHQVQKFLGTV